MFDSRNVDIAVLSAILHPETPGGEVEEDAIEFWESLRKKFGDDVVLGA